jgi:hypothetical protein
VAQLWSRVARWLSGDGSGMVWRWFGDGLGVAWCWSEGSLVVVQRWLSDSLGWLSSGSKVARYIMV